MTLSSLRHIYFPLFCGLTVGCSSLSTFEMGYADGYSNRRGRSGGIFEGHVGAGESAFGIGGSARIRIAGEVQQLALGAHGYALAPAPIGHLFFRGGLQMLQFEHLDGDFAFGTGSPFASIGLIFPSRYSRTAGPIVLSFSTGLDVRVTGQESEGFWIIALGAGASLTED